jgi:predicted N-acetyltransferase YhbS
MVRARSLKAARPRVLGLTLTLVDARGCRRGRGPRVVQSPILRLENLTAAAVVVLSHGPYHCSEKTLTPRSHASLPSATVYTTRTLLASTLSTGAGPCAT